MSLDSHGSCKRGRDEADKRREREDPTNQTVTPVHQPSIRQLPLTDELLVLPPSSVLRLHVKNNRLCLRSQEIEGGDERRREGGA